MINNFCDELKPLIDKSLSTREIANSIGISQTAVRYRLNKCNLTTNNKPQTRLKPKNRQEQKKKKGRKIRLDLIKYLGGKCQKCGYCKNSAVLTFHHVEEKTKKFKLDMRSCSNRSLVKLYAEAKKCILLCANCHTELHHPSYEITT